LQGRVTELEEELAARDEEIKRLRAAVPRVQEADDVGR
jgi:uncharacterized small protein (DUF1192 family)